jgi:hypothetical protein
MKAFLLDTNVLSEVWKPQPAMEVITWLESNEWYLPVTTIAELQEGATAAPSAARAAEINAKLDEILSEYEGSIVDWDGETARTWGKLARSPEAKLQPQPLWDSLLDALAVRHHAIIATRNTRDFRHAETFNPWTGSEHPAVEPGA